MQFKEQVLMVIGGFYIKHFFTLTLTLFFLVGCVSEDNNPNTIPEQLSERQEHFTEVLIKEDTEYGQLVFYSLENEEGMTGVGLAIFKDENGKWEYSDGTAHLLSRGDVAGKGSIKINEDVKVVYGYVNNLPIDDSKLIKSEDIEEDTLLVNDSFISYTFIQPERQLDSKFE
ncbi:hypothetical protein VBD025_15220 [Virgibacillus flavescens]|uniref:hypothetical protein n=1 Tax=Virgibacillus flavescens TaxID=1611422 RepID=UPI003D32F5D7